MIRVVIAEDMDILRESLKYMIESDEEIKVVGLACNGREAFELCGIHNPDIVLMDIKMPICDGLEGTNLIKSAYPHIKVLILTTFEDEKNIVSSLKCGVDGYITKDILPLQLQQSIKSVMMGLGVMKRNIMYSVADGKEPHNGNSTVLSINLTSKEKKLIGLIVDGKSYKEMGKATGLSEGYVRNIVSEILVKLNLKDRVQLAVFAVKNKIV